MKRKLAMFPLALVLFLSITVQVNADIIPGPEPIDMTLSQTLFVKGHMKKGLEVQFDLDDEYSSPVTVDVTFQHMRSQRTWEFTLTDELQGSTFYFTLIMKRMPAGLYNLGVHIYS